MESSAALFISASGFVHKHHRDYFDYGVEGAFLGVHDAVILLLHFQVASVGIET